MIRSNEIRKRLGIPTATRDRSGHNTLICSRRDVKFIPEEAAEIIISFGLLIPVRRGFPKRQINLLNFHFTLTNRMKKLDNYHKKVGAVAAAPRLPKPIEM